MKIVKNLRIFTIISAPLNSSRAHQAAKKLFVLIVDQISYQRFGFQYINFQYFFLFKLKWSSSHANKIEIRYGHERISNVRKNYPM